MANETAIRMWEFMISYQDENGEPPSMQEIVNELDTLSFNSSVRYNMRVLVGDGLVHETGEAGAPRRYTAIETSDE